MQPSFISILLPDVWTFGNSTFHTFLNTPQPIAFHSVAYVENDIEPFLLIQSMGIGLVRENIISKAS